MNTEQTSPAALDQLFYQKKLPRKAFCCREPSNVYLHDSLYQLFLQQAKRNANKVAVEFQDEAVSYLQLKKQSEQLAHVMLEKGIESEDVVAICMPRSVEFVLAILSVLKVGAAFILLDPNTSHIRNQELLQQGKCTYLLSTQDIFYDITQIWDIYTDQALPKFIDVDHEVLCAKNEMVQDADEGVTYASLAQQMVSYDPVFGMCTLQFEHASFIEVIRKVEQRIEVNSNGRMLLATSVHQSRFIVELFLALSKGISCVLVSPLTLHHPEKIKQIIIKKEINLFFAPLFIWQNLSDIGLRYDKSFTAVCVRDYIGEEVDLTIFEQSRLVLFYDDFLDTVLCSGLNTKSFRKETLKHFGETLAYYPEPDNGCNYMLSVIGIPRMTTASGLERAGHYLKDYYGEIYAFINTQPKMLYAHGTKLCAEEIESLLNQHPAVVAAHVKKYKTTLEIEIEVNSEYCRIKEPGGISINAKELTQTSYPETKASDAANLIALAARLNNFMANKLVVGVKPDSYLFTTVAKR